MEENLKIKDKLKVSSSLFEIRRGMYKFLSAVFLNPPGQEMISIFSIPSPIMIIFGAVLLTSRLFPILTLAISNFLWKRRVNLISFSLKNLSMRRDSSTRAVIIIALSFAFLISFLAFPFSFLAHQETLIHYEIGSDVRIDMRSIVLNYTNIENLLENTDKLKGKLKENVEEYALQAALSKKLATIILDVPVDFNEKQMEVSEPDKDMLETIFEELEFRALAKKMLGDSIFDSIKIGRASCRERV